MDTIRLRPSNRELRNMAVRLFAAGDGNALITTVSAQPPETAFTTLRLLAENAPMNADVGHLIAHSDRLSNLIAGAVLHGRAIRHRGMDDAESVSDKQWGQYLPTLAKAQELILEASGADLFSGIAAAWRMTAFVDASESEKDAAEAALLVADDVSVSGLSRLVSARAQKWGGSHAEMWRVARANAERNLPGTLSLLAKAHYEHHLWLERFEDDPRVAAGAKSYFRDHVVITELIEASRRVLDGRSPADPRNILYADNWFAWVFWNADRSELARPHLKRMGKNVDSSIWLVPGPRWLLNLVRIGEHLVPA